MSKSLYWRGLLGWLKWKLGPRRSRADQEHVLAVCGACPHLGGDYVKDTKALRLAAKMFGRKHAPVMLVCRKCDCLLGAEVPEGSPLTMLTHRGKSFTAAAKTEAKWAHCDDGNW